MSVIIPTRNRASLVVDAVSSALNQEGVNVEVIVVDDGSVDDTPAVLSAIADARVTVIRRSSDHGEPNARNAGVAAASHEWIAFLDDDDRWASAKLAPSCQPCAQRTVRRGRSRLPLCERPGT